LLQAVAEDALDLLEVLQLGEEFEICGPERTVRLEGLYQLRPGGFESLHGTGVRGNGGVQGLTKFLFPIFNGQEEGFGEQRFFGSEVIADSGKADAASRRDIAGRSISETLFQQTALRSLQKSFPISH